jgi:hypothetical protein
MERQAEAQQGRGRGATGSWPRRNGVVAEAQRVRGRGGTATRARAEGRAACGMSEAQGYGRRNGQGKDVNAERSGCEMAARE